MRYDSSTVLRTQGSQPLPPIECLLSVRNIFVPGIHDVVDDVILHDADEQNVVQMSWIEWGQILDLAVSSGWDPFGTNPPSLSPVSILQFAPSPEERWEAWEQGQQESWSRTYLSLEFPEVVQDDACAMADALESALPDLEEEKFKENLKEFIAFSQNSGGFTIGRLERELR
jgi:hypothetical protein